MDFDLFAFALSDRKVGLQVAFYEPRLDRMGRSREASPFAAIRPNRTVVGNLVANESNQGTPSLCHQITHRLREEAPCSSRPLQIGHPARRTPLPECTRPS